jgi:O-antigen ligase
VSVAYWLQTLLPLAAFVLGTWVRLQPLSVARGVIIGGLIPGALSLVLLVPAGFTGALTRLPQLHNLLPLAIFVGTAFAVAFHDRARKLSLCSMAVSAFLLPGLWSRSSLGFLLLAVGITALLGVGAVPKHKRAVAGLALVWVAMLGVGLAYQATQHGNIGDREATASLSFAAERRQEIYGVAIDRALSSPIVGDAFGTVGNIRLSSGVRADFSTLFPTENQYLDYAIRAGLLAPILLLWILVGTGRRGLALARGPDLDSARFGRATVGIVAGTLLVNNFHLFMVQGQSAVILWFVFGYASRLAAIRRDTLSDVGDEAGVDKSGADAPARSDGGDRGRRPGGGGVFR